MQGFCLHLVVFVTKPSICFSWDPKPTCSCLSIAFHARFGDVSSQRTKTELVFMERLSKDLKGFLYLSPSSIFSELPKEARGIFCFPLPLAQTGLSLLMKWLLPMSGQLMENSTKRKIQRNLARWGCP